MEKLTLVFPLAVLFFIFILFYEYITLLRLPLPPLALPGKSFGRKDLFWMLLITAVYAVTAFWGLGNTDNPERFCKFQERGQYALIELEEETQISAVKYYTGLHTGDYHLQVSLDGENFTDIKDAMPQSYADVFKWKDAELGEEPVRAKYIRIIAGSELWLGEMAIYDENGIISPDTMEFEGGTKALFDEQETVPEYQHYTNSTYFDEIYHARTAYENVENVYPYEISHPPLGKLIMSIGIRLFGMNTFGWRCMGALFGVLMLPGLYMLLKKLFGGTAVPACMTAVFAFDFMHFTQTRIATIDTYGVFFTILMYLFMYIYLQTDRDEPLVPKWKSLVPLGLSGVCFGLGAASKWTAIYAGAGLGVLWLIDRIERGVALIRAGQARRYWRKTAGNVLFCIVFFVIVPCSIYYCSYYPYGAAKGMSGVSMFFKKEYFDIVLDNQEFMFTYHVGVDAEHPYSSAWYQWIIDARPILYYLKYFDDGTKSAIGAFVNPALCWLGLLAIFAMGYLAIFRGDKKARFILIGYLAQLVPWMFVTRVVFEYHYFPSVIFLTLAVGYIMDFFRRHRSDWKKPLGYFTGLCIGLFALFYPVLSGIAVPTWFSRSFLRWIDISWPF